MKVVCIILLLLQLTLNIKAKSLEEKQLKSAMFSNLTLTLFWENHQSDKAHLLDEGDCIYTGQLDADALSQVLVTGCQEEDSLSIQVQSGVVGDRLFSLENGEIAYITYSDEELEYQDYIENEEFETMFGVVAEKNGRLKRNSEEEVYNDNFYYYDEPEENTEFDETFPELADNEVDDFPVPKKLIFNINVYLDEAWYQKFGRQDASKEAKQVLRHAQNLYKHPTLNTKIDLQFGDRIYESSAPHIEAHKGGLYEFEKHLRSPYKMEGKYAVAHLHLTAAPPGKKSIYLGKAKISSICDENPKAIVKYKFSKLRTGMTVAHELGHILGMQHDFKKLNGRRGKCKTNKRAGGTVMNYGDGREIWSDCSNQDFKTTYSRIFLGNAGFCLKDPAILECKCNGKSDIGGGECKAASALGPWCYVDSNSGCQDKQEFFSSLISVNACAARTGCQQHQWQCETSKECIPKELRCDFIRRHCSDGSDEAHCDFPEDIFDD